MRFWLTRFFSITTITYYLLTTNAMGAGSSDPYWELSTEPHSLLSPATSASGPTQLYQHLPSNRDHWQLSGGALLYVGRMFAEGFLVQGVFETMIWAIKADCIMLCEATERQMMIREHRVRQYQQIDLMDGKEDGMYNGTMVGFTQEWENRDRSYELEDYQPESPPLAKDKGEDGEEGEEEAE